MLTKVTKHSKNKLQAKKQNWGQLIFAVPWIIRNKTLPPIVGCLPLSYTFLSYCNGLLKILQRIQICSVCCTSESWKAFSFRGASPPDPLTRGSAPGPCWGLCPKTLVIGSRSITRSPCVPPKKLQMLNAPLNIIWELETFRGGIKQCSGRVGLLICLKICLVISSRRLSRRLRPDLSNASEYDNCGKLILKQRFCTRSISLESLIV